MDRTTLIEIASVEAAVATYESPAYQEALTVLGDAAERDTRIVPAGTHPQGGRGGAPLQRHLDP